MSKVGYKALVEAAEARVRPITVAEAIGSKAIGSKAVGGEVTPGRK